MEALLPVVRANGSVIERSTDRSVVRPQLVVDAVRENASTGVRPLPAEATDHPERSSFVAGHGWLQAGSGGCRQLGNVPRPVQSCWWGLLHESYKLT